MQSGALRLGARPITGRVGAVVDTIDLRDELSDVQVKELHELIAERGIVIIAGQDVGPHGHRQLARQLGDIKMPPDYFPTLQDDGFPEIGVIDSTGPNGADTWHTDVPVEPAPPRYSILHFQHGPESGGDTMWASQVAAYQRLSPAMREFLTPLTAEFIRVTKIRDRSAIHPIVQRHPVTGELALYVSPANTSRIIELEPAESDAVLALLFERVLQPESICRWRWTPGDIGIWDNHFVLHYAIGDYDERRLIHRIEIEGETPIPATD